MLAASKSRLLSLLVAAAFLLGADCGEVCNLSECVTVEVHPGTCPAGAALDAQGEPRELEQGCPPGALGHRLPLVDGGAVPVRDHPFLCDVLRILECIP